MEEYPATTKERIRSRTMLNRTHLQSRTHLNTRIPSFLVGDPQCLQQSVHPMYQSTQD